MQIESSFVCSFYKKLSLLFWIICCNSSMLASLSIDILNKSRLTYEEWCFVLPEKGGSCFPTKGQFSDWWSPSRSHQTTRNQPWALEWSFDTTEYRWLIGLGPPFLRRYRVWCHWLGWRVGVWCYPIVHRCIYHLSWDLQSWCSCFLCWRLLSLSRREDP